MIWYDFLLLLAGAASGIFLLVILAGLLAWRMPVRIGFDIERIDGRRD